ncbi:MAG: hypothetical protein M3Z64_01450 [Verrucomicrobiota bacterium]|nr:hypothetical protein [Verrucomicrobiota bacterium]
MKFVVTAGPTREPIDPVRFLSNRSSGKMGFALAEAAVAAGHEVTLIAGPVCIAPPIGAQTVPITTSDELFDAVRNAIVDCDVLVMCAAVADYRPVAFSSEKTAKRRDVFTLALKPTPDILASLATTPRNYYVVGFAAQTHDLEANARRKLVEKNCDMIVANDVSRADCGIGSDENEVIIFSRDGEEKRIARAKKKVIARALIKIISDAHEKSLTKNS